MDFYLSKKRMCQDTIINSGNNWVSTDRTTYKIKVIFIRYSIHSFTAINHELFSHLTAVEIDPAEAL